MLDNIKSIYIHGDPGCGKSFIMEKFFEDISCDGLAKRFMHY